MGGGHCQEMLERGQNNPVYATHAKWLLAILIVSIAGPVALVGYELMLFSTRAKQLMPQRMRPWTLKDRQEGIA